MCQQKHYTIIAQRGADMQKQRDFILLHVLEPWVEYCLQTFFVAVLSAEIEVKIASVLISSACGGKWARS